MNDNEEHNVNGYFWKKTRKVLGKKEMIVADNEIF